MPDEQSVPVGTSETINLYLYSVAFVCYDLGYGQRWRSIFRLGALLFYLRKRTQLTETLTA